MKQYQAACSDCGRPMICYRAPSPKRRQLCATCKEIARADKDRRRYLQRREGQVAVAVLEPPRRRMPVIRECGQPEPAACEEPTAALPGTEEKVEVMRRRLACGLLPCAAGDARRE